MATLPDASGFEFNALRGALNYRNALINEFRPYLKDRVLEVGAGIGQFTEVLLSLTTIDELVSIEPDPIFCAQLRRSWPALALVQGTTANLALTYACDVIISVNVLEHIEDDAAELRRYHQLLQKGRGVICLFLPARPEIYAPLDRDFGHFRRYTREDLRGKLGAAGFEIVKLRYFNLIGYLAWWLSFCALKKRSFNAKAVTLFDRFIFPPTHTLELLMGAPPIGQSLVAIARAS